MTLYSELASKFGSTIGVDARTDPNARAALERARDQQQTTLSGRTVLSVDLPSPQGKLRLPLWRRS